MTTSYIKTFESYIGDEDCIIGIVDFTDVKPWKGSANSCPSDADFYGFTDIVFEVMDMGGKVSAELTAAMTDIDKERIELEILDMMRG